MTANASWTGKLTRKHPVPRFSGSGEMTFFGEGESLESPDNFDTTLVSTGDFLTPRPGGLDPANGTQRSFTTVPTDSFKNKTVVLITVFGGRISTQPYPRFQRLPGALIQVGNSTTSQTGQHPLPCLLLRKPHGLNLNTRLTRIVHHA